MKIWLISLSLTEISLRKPRRLFWRSKTHSGRSSSRRVGDWRFAGSKAVTATARRGRHRRRSRSRTRWEVRAEGWRPSPPRSCWRNLVAQNGWSVSGKKSEEDGEFGTYLDPERRGRADKRTRCLSPPSRSSCRRSSGWRSCARPRRSSLLRLKSERRQMSPFSCCTALSSVHHATLFSVRKFPIFFQIFKFSNPTSHQRLRLSTVRCHIIAPFLKKQCNFHLKAQVSDKTLNDWNFTKIRPPFSNKGDGGGKNSPQKDDRSFELNARCVRAKLHAISMSPEIGNFFLALGFEKEVKPLSSASC